VSGGGACFPAATSPAGDQGRALGTITFSGMITDGDNITIDDKNYEFDTTNGSTCSGSQDVCLDASDIRSEGQLAQILVAAEAGTNSYMASRAAVAYVYSNTAGTAGNTIPITEGQDTNGVIDYSGDTLTDVTAENASPFVIQPNLIINSIGIGNTAGSGLAHATVTGQIEPGETLYISASITGETSQDMYVCETAGFTYGASPACTGTEICNVTGVNPSTDYAQCSSAALAAVPKEHGSHSVYVYAQDSSQVEDDGANNGPHSFTAADVPPELVSYTANETPSPSAMGSHSVDFTINLKDDNGDSDVTSVAGVLFDKNAVTNTCTADEQNCYIDSSCTITTGTSDENLSAQCTVTFWYNGNASDWDVQAEAADELGTVEFTNANVSLNNPALQAVNISQASLDYSTVAAGDASTVKTTTMQNVGNQILDIYIDGDTMCTDYNTCNENTISYTQQKWHHDDSDFYWDESTTSPGPYILVDTASGTDDETGCLNRDISVKEDPATGGQEESIYWIIRIPATQETGSYTGANTFAATHTSTCSDSQSY